MWYIPFSFSLKLNEKSFMRNVIFCFIRILKYFDFDLIVETEHLFLNV